MKKIVPFNNVLNFNTDVCDITAISLEHNINKESDIISGTFYISGEYKIIDGNLQREKFDFELPFDIALGNNYDLDSLLVDIDDFRYELVDRNKLKVNIDMYIDGEVLEIPKEVEDKDLLIEEEIRESKDLVEEEINLIEEPKEEDDKSLRKSEEETNEKEETLEEPIEEPTQIPIQERLDLFDEMLDINKEETMKDESINNENDNENKNIFNSFNDEEKYVTYKVYRVLDTDTIDKIMEKYNVTKEELMNYNNIEDLRPGDKLIIPANDK